MIPSARGSRTPRTRATSAAALGAALVLVGCGGGSGAGGGAPGGGPPAMGVEVLTLALRPVEATTEYIGTVKSRRSTTIQPQVEGFVTRIAVRSGERVRAGQVLLEIDAGRQRAAVASLESMRAVREADLAFARQQAERQRKLLEAGAVSQQELEWAETTLRTAEAQLKAIEEQISEQRVELAYHRVTAPAAGVVGDIPVRVGDRVTTSTLLTTIDAPEGLELYLYVPVRMAAELRTGLEVRILDDRGGLLATTAVGFVSPQVDEGTQAVLVKAPVPRDLALRNEQFVRARIVWRADPGLTVPVTAVSRVNGVYFAFVAEDVEGRTVARQREVRLGAIVGNDYVLLDGLAPGDRLIVSGVQKIGDGMPVSARSAGTAPAAAPAPDAARG